MVVVGIPCRYAITIFKLRGDILVETPTDSQGLTAEPVGVVRVAQPRDDTSDATVRPGIPECREVLTQHVLLPLPFDGWCILLMRQLAK